jgi:pimeloyl-ACP methyl ester carboxylesterase
MDDLSTDYRTYALDLWGFGDSDKTGQGYELDAYVQLLVDFMDELGLWRVPLVGHTLGGAVAAMLAVKHPDRVSRIMTVGLPLGSQGINRRLLSASFNDSLGRFFWHRQKPYTEVESGAAKAAETAVISTIQQVAKLDVHELLDEIGVPVLTLYGDKDNVIDPAQADEVDEEHFGARSIVLPGTRHFPMLDQPATFGRLLRDFMAADGPEGLQQLAIKKEWRRRTR